ncbi:MAG: hypothetical protein AAF206_08230, partial [Bacteroidota bacterium]
APVDIHFRLPNFRLNGEIFSETVSFGAVGNFEGSWDLSGYELAPVDGDMILVYDARLQSNGSRIELPNTRIIFDNLSHQYAEGYFGLVDVSLGMDSLTFELEVANNDFSYAIADPEVSFLIDNSYGIPIELQVDRLEILTREAGVVSINTPVIEEGLILNHPSLDEAGSFRTTAITLNKDNSNLPEAISAWPEGINYDLAARSHPEGDSSTIGFMTDSSQLRLGLAVDIPIEGQIRDLEVEDRFEVDLDQLDEVSSADFVLLLENGLPIEIDVQVFFEDASGQVLDSLFQNALPLMEAAPVDGNGVVNTPASFERSVNFSEEKLDALKETSQLRLRGRFATTDNGSVPVKIFRDYASSLKMGVRIRR